MARHLLIGSAVVAVLGMFAAPSAERPPERPGSRLATPTAERPPEWASGRLVLGLHPPERVAVIDVRTGRNNVRRLSGGTLCHGPLLVSGGRLIRSGSIGRRPAAVSMGLGLGGRGKPLGEAHQFLPSATPGRLWLTTVRYGRSVTALRSVREVTVAGRTTFVARNRAPGLNLLGALRDGLLFERKGRLRVWDPYRGREVRSMPGGFVLALHGRRVARCRGRCAKLHVTGPRSDLVLSLPRPEANQGAFSPDGSTLAAVVRGGRIALADLAGRSVRLIPAARVAGHGRSPGRPTAGGSSSRVPVAV